jgi:hypothetical protein
MTFTPCDGPKRESEGTYYCPIYAHWESEDDCRICRFKFERAVDSEVERRLEKKVEEERDVWGG